MKFGTIVLQVNTSYFRNGVISSRKCYHLVSAYAASIRRLYNSIRQFVVGPTFVLVY